MSTITTEAMSTEAATDLTMRIREAGSNAVKARKALASLVTKAKKEQAHTALGFTAWPEYVAHVFSEEAMPNLGKDDRAYLVGFMAGEGMSSRAVARALGISQSTANRMIAKAVESGEVEADEIESTDGKTRSRRASSKAGAKANASKAKPETKPESEVKAGPSIHEASTDDLRALAIAVIGELSNRWVEGDEAAEAAVAEVAAMADDLVNVKVAA